jgi:hypothetical protein
MIIIQLHLNQFILCIHTPEHLEKYFACTQKPMEINLGNLRSVDLPPVNDASHRSHCLMKRSALVAQHRKNKLST